MTERLYAILARNIKKDISVGRHQPGGFLPGEFVLAETHGVSRATVRAALGLLEREGVIERRRGSGTQVLAPRPPGGFGQSVRTTEELNNYARDTRRVVSSTDDIVADKTIAEGLGVPPGSRWICIKSLRVDPKRPDRPICASESYVAPNLTEIKAHLKDETTALCDILACHCGVRVDSIEQELQGTIVPNDLSATLVVPPGAPALRILRRYRDAGGWVFLLTVGIYPADRFAYRMRLDRSDTVS